ncbi:hypothetical protein D3C84_1045170 [compost metagenome]
MKTEKITVCSSIIHPAALKQNIARSLFDKPERYSLFEGKGVKSAEQILKGYRNTHIANHGFVIAEVD